MDRAGRGCCPRRPDRFRRGHLHQRRAEGRAVHQHHPRCSDNCGGLGRGDTDDRSRTAGSTVLCGRPATGVHRSIGDEWTVRQRLRVASSYELWATRRLHGDDRVVVLDQTLAGCFLRYATNSYRLQAGDADDRHVAHRRRARARPVHDGHSRRRDDRLVRLERRQPGSAGDVTRRPDQHGLGFTDNWFTGDHQMISAVQPWLAVRGLPVEQIAYHTSQDFTSAVVVTVAEPAAGCGAEPPTTARSPCASCSTAPRRSPSTAIRRCRHRDRRRRLQHRHVDRRRLHRHRRRDDARSRS